MSSHDLLSYSIMNHGSKLDYRPASSAYPRDRSPMSLPPLYPIIKQLAPAHSSIGSSPEHHQHVLLPPLSSNYTTSYSSATSPSSTISTGSNTPNYSHTAKLTENNLRHLGNSLETTAHSGLGLLTSAIANISSQERLEKTRTNSVDSQSFNRRLSGNTVSTPNAHSVNSNTISHNATHHIQLPSLLHSSSSTLSSVASSVSSVSPMSSPSIPAASASGTSAVKDSAVTTGNSNNKRRQRLGPSCDSCRLRKVKCNAEITILSKSVSDEPNVCSLLLAFNLSAEQVESVLRQGELVKVANDFNLIVSNNKLIKFKSCNSCNMKSLTCCFTKGFTKEDIMVNSSKKSDGSSAKKEKEKPAKIAKKKLAPTSTTSVNAVKSISSLTKALSKTLETQQEQVYSIHEDHQQSHQNIASKQVLIKSNSPVTSGAVLSTSVSVPGSLSTSSNSSNTRKSSCTCCRKRKVKCVFIEAQNKCESCIKKNADCLFDNRASYWV
ncbi:fungal transcriptional regulatory protein [Scheffersomyces stipitis CBS 6054]|uniref:Fungal transcriptional regulatory protein n=1 Tax=Scheffersomyces stipitis (strain ATCC 58785 / CBS 6054 / NBRC 10063 / NRRL Y-11545) TaxID=322104 RepID=A3LZ58_PICST|nr:fungal transcriptional regulatory protein [Scheffersomyces stipitis CBS 6054]ABN68283.2 fungal transcriptional regulatory protein [Scheffersomyces stipitis CBS 6054]